MRHGDWRRGLCDGETDDDGLCEGEVAVVGEKYQ
jgi:hypothetical protein